MEEDKEAKNREEFAKAFDEICQKYKLALQPEIGFKQQEDGTYSIAVRLRVIPIL